MLRYITMLAPMLLSSRSDKPKKNMGLLIIAYLSLIAGGLLVLTGLHIYLAQQIGVAPASAITGGVLLAIGGICLLIVHKDPKSAQDASPPASVAGDPLAEFIPKDVLENPNVEQLLQKLQENPVSSTATAFTVGLILARNL